jgi:glyoxylate reductase
MKDKVLVTREIPEIGIKLLKEKYDVDCPGKGALDKQALETRIHDCRAVVSLLSDPIDEKVLSASPALKIVANYAVGYNNIDVAAAEKLNIMVTHTPGVLTNATAEIAFALLISLTRRILQADRFTRNKRFVGWDPLLFLGDELQGKTLGILGMGRIGLDMAAKCRAFGMNIVYHNRNPVNKSEEERLGAVYMGLDDLLSRADVISVHTPMTPGTHHLLDETAFSKMKIGVYLINTARGEVVCEKALIGALESGRIKGAGFDVYEFEPRIPEKLFTMENVVLLPHIGSATVETRNRMAEMAARNVIDALEGRIPENLIPEMKTLTGDGQ